MAQGKTEWAHKCMLYAGKVLAAAAIDMINDPDKLAKAQEEHRETLPAEGYVNPIPPHIQPPVPEYEQ